MDTEFGRSVFGVGIGARTRVYFLDKLNFRRRRSPAGQGPVGPPGATTSPRCLLPTHIVEMNPGDVVVLRSLEKGSSTNSREKVTEAGGEAFSCMYSIVV